MLSRFVRRSLLECVDADHFRMHDMAREYASKTYTPIEMAALRYRHADFFAKVIAVLPAALTTRDELWGLQSFDIHRLNLESAFEWLRSAIWPSPGDSMKFNPEFRFSLAQILVELVDLVAMGPWAIRFRARQRLEWARSYFRAARILNDSDHIVAGMGRCALAYIDLRRPRIAYLLLENVLKAARNFENQESANAALAGMASLLAEKGQHKEALLLLFEVLAADRASGNQKGEAGGLCNIGISFFRLGNSELALASFNEAIDAAQASGAKLFEANIWLGMGRVYHSLGDFKMALQHFENARERYCELGERGGEGRARFNGAISLRALGESADAHVWARAALSIYQDIDDSDAATVLTILHQWDAMT